MCNENAFSLSLKGVKIDKTLGFKDMDMSGLTIYLLSRGGFLKDRVLFDLSNVPRSER